MGSPTTPVHGKLACIYAHRPNGFKGAGLNDLTWGTGFNGAASAYFEVVIDGVGTGIGAVDEFKWRVNGGAWTEHVDITGTAQTLSDTQTVTFAATTGHTATDQWTIGNFKDEATTEAGSQATITDATKRYLNANNLPTFTDDGGKAVLIIDPTRGIATFNGAVGNVDVDGNNGFIVKSGLQLVGYMYDWSLDFSLDLADASRQGEKWKEGVPGQASGTGSAGMFFIATRPFLDLIASTTTKYFLLELYVNDPSANQTGDHFVVWATITGLNAQSPVGDVAKETINFQVQHAPCFIEAT